MIGTLQHIVSQMSINSDTFTFEYGKRGYINVLEDELLLPAVIYDTESIFNLTPSQSGFIGEGGRAILSFMYKSELEWTPKQHYDNCIEPAINAARQFISLCQASELIEEISVGDGREFINLLDKNTSGIQFPFSIKLRVDKNVCVDYTPADNCQPVILTINGVEVETILSGTVFPLKVTLDGTQSGTYNEATDTWEVESEPCAAATYTIKDRDETTLYSGSIASGENLNQYIENTTVEVNDSSFADVLAQGSINIQVVNTENTQKGSKVGSDWLLPNININKSDSTLIATIPSVKDYNVADSSVSVNGNAYANIKATDSLDVAVHNTESTQLGSNNAGVWEIPDTTYNIYVNGILNQTFNVPTLKNETINITP